MGAGYFNKMAKFQIAQLLPLASVKILCTTRDLSGGKIWWKSFLAAWDFYSFFYIKEKKKYIYNHEDDGFYTASFPPKTICLYKCLMETPLLGLEEDDVVTSGKKDPKPPPHVFCFRLCSCRRQKEKKIPGKTDLADEEKNTHISVLMSSLLPCQTQNCTSLPEKEAAVLTE